MHIKIDIRGIAQCHLNGVVLWREGYQSTEQTTIIISIW